MNRQAIILAGVAALIILAFALVGSKSGTDQSMGESPVVFMKEDIQETEEVQQESAFESKDTVNIGGKWTFKVDLAVTPEQRAQGLSGRDYLADDEGLLFVFQNPGIHNFWMKDMNFVIDIIWIGEDKRVVDITENASPESYPAEIFNPSSPALYVLEINAGLAERHGIEIRDITTLNLERPGI